MMAAAGGAGTDEDAYGSLVPDDEELRRQCEADFARNDEEELRRQCEAEYTRAASLSPTQDTYRDDDEWRGDDNESSEEMFDDSNDSGISYGGGGGGGNHGGNMDFGAENTSGTAGVEPAIAGGGGGGGGVFGDGYHSDSDDDPDASFDLLAHCAGSFTSDGEVAQTAGDNGNAMMNGMGDGEINHGMGGRRGAARPDDGTDMLGLDDENDRPAYPPSPAENAAREPSHPPERHTARDAASPRFSVDAPVPSPVNNTAPGTTRPKFSMGTGSPSPSSARTTKRGGSAASPRSSARNTGQRGSVSSSRSPVRNTARGTARQRLSKGAASTRGGTTPQRAVPGPSKTPLRRSPRVAAAVAAAVANVAVPAGADVTSALRNVRKRAGPASTSASGVATPYSTRRARRASTAFKTVTPGAESFSGGDGGMDSSFWWVAE